MQIVWDTQNGNNILVSQTVPWVIEQNNILQFWLIGLSKQKTCLAFWNCNVIFEFS